MADTYNLNIDQGASFTRTLTLQNADETAYDLTGCTFSGQIRNNFSSRDRIATLTVAIQGAATDGVVAISLTPAQTRSLPLRTDSRATREKTVYVYDLLMTRPDGTVIRLLEGAAEISPGVTE